MKRKKKNKPFSGEADLQSVVPALKVMDKRKLNQQEVQDKVKKQELVEVLDAFMAQMETMFKNIDKQIEDIKEWQTAVEADLESLNEKINKDKCKECGWELPEHRVFCSKSQGGE